MGFLHAFAPKTSKTVDSKMFFFFRRGVTFQAHRTIQEKSEEKQTSWEKKKTEEGLGVLGWF